MLSHKLYPTCPPSNKLINLAKNALKSEDEDNEETVKAKAAQTDIEIDVVGP